jgi:hypothetical protein
MENDFFGECMHDLEVMATCIIHTKGNVIAMAQLRCLV